MKNEEAIESLKCLIYVDEIKMAIQALEKQVAKKPINDYVEDETHSGNRFKKQIKVCECGNIYLQKYQKYCNECGQRIDWSKE